MSKAKGKVTRTRGGKLRYRSTIIVTPPVTKVIVNPDGHLYGVKPKELDKTDKVRFTINGARFDVQISGRGSDACLEVRTVDGMIIVSPNSGNVVDLRMEKPR